MEEANKDKGLVKKTIFGCCDSLTASSGPGGLRCLGRWQRSCLGMNQCAFCHRGRPCRGEHPECPPMGCLRGNPNWRQGLVNLLDERVPHIDGWGLSACLAPDSTWSILITPGESRVTPDMAGRRTEFLEDTGAACSVLTWPSLQLRLYCDGSWWTVKGKAITSSLTWGVQSIITTHSLLYIPEFYVPFSEDLINKLGASILLGWGEVKEGREFKQRLHRLATPDDPPAGHQNIPPKIREQVGIPQDQERENMFLQ